MLAAHSVAIVLGTRSEIVKLAGVIEELGDAAFVIHTGPHDERESAEVCFEELRLPGPAYRISIGGTSRAEQIGHGVSQLGALFDRHRPAAVVVQGDTNSALAGGLAANACDRPLVHVEAGLRSWDKALPEEHNRVLLDHISDLLAAPTAGAVANLAAEGITGESVLCCGNTVVEAVRRQLPTATVRRGLLEQFGLRRNGFVLATMHRPENTENPAVLRMIVESLAGLGIPVVLSLHPRTAAAVREADLVPAAGDLRVCAPMSGIELLALAAEAALLISDSSDVQEEVTMLGRPLLVVRRSTERPESLVDFARLIRPDQIVSAAAEFLADPGAVHRRLAGLPSPFGDGSASTGIVREIHRRYATIPIQWRPHTGLGAQA